MSDILTIEKDNLVLIPGLANLQITITDKCQVIANIEQAIEFLCNHKTDKGDYSFSSAETKQYPGVDSLYERELLKKLKKH